MGKVPVQSIAQALILVDGLMHEWIAILDEKQQGVMKEPHVPGARRLDLQRLEGVAVSFLCTNDAEVRRLALETLKTVRTLHRSLLASGEAPLASQAASLTFHRGRLQTLHTLHYWASGLGSAVQLHSRKLFIKFPNAVSQSDELSPDLVIESSRFSSGLIIALPIHLCMPMPGRQLLGDKSFGGQPALCGCLAAVFDTTWLPEA